MAVILVAAVAKNNIIGRDGKIPWHIPEDMKRFKEITRGKNVLMGRKTFESILGYLGKPLPERKNLVITRQEDYLKNCRYIRDREYSDISVEVHQNIEKVLGVYKNEDIYVIGGAEIYKQTLPLAKKLYITEVHQEVEGDAFFPEINKEDWREVGREDREGYSFVEYDRNLYQCPECGFHYKDKEFANKCEVWCRENKSCNIEITAHAEENGRNV